MSLARNLMHQLATATSMTPPDPAMTTWDLAIEDRSITLEDGGAVLILSTPLGTALRAHPAPFWQHLLALNTTLVVADGGAITIDRPGHTISLTQVWPASQYASRNLPDCLGTFIAQARRLVDTLNRTLPLDTSSEDGEPESGGAATSTKEPVFV
ncbi:hypothetical protein WM40_18285 [Robbsia andropogonis]|uniref:Type III secretion system chaperone n=1 Tax=Robbsia andropogonis TaxID=28092 RepID=A0A0F5JWM4_9BURK|nr:type III secretion system chaperone [Robbsia andropogonis]KKB62258.1 hypothetical protein WM40_18285 [Robbsia andropogonis]MCP1120565.1 type III secretion system chaperone [Robbsia andropogonis]MCP1130526.1 type III secretion system chaperone [Robbsia andropogonis]